jgi:hypothetical protein
MADEAPNGHELRPFWRFVQVVGGILGVAAGVVARPFSFFVVAVAAVLLVAYFVRDERGRTDEQRLRKEAADRERGLRRELAERADRVQVSTALTAIRELINAIDDSRPVESQLRVGARRNLRGNVMTLRAQSEDLLEIRFNSEGYLPEERAKTWHRSEGIVGEAWSRGTRVLGGYAGEVGAVALANVYLREIQAEPGIRETIRTVLSIPLCDPNEQTAILGILNLDDDLPLRESCLSSPNFVEAATHFASTIARVLSNRRSAEPDALAVLQR